MFRVKAWSKVRARIRVRPGAVTVGLICGKMNTTVCVCVSQGSEDGDKTLKRKEKNRVAAQKSRKRQTQRADLLHEVCVCVIVAAA